MTYSNLIGMRTGMVQTRGVRVDACVAGRCDRAAPMRSCGGAAAAIELLIGQPPKRDKLVGMFRYV